MEASELRRLRRAHFGVNNDEKNLSPVLSAQPDDHSGRQDRKRSCNRQELNLCLHEERGSCRSFCSSLCPHRLVFIFFSPAFLCRCGEQPTSAVFSGSGI